LIYFGKLKESGAPIWVMLPVVFLCTAFVMVLIAEEVARTFLRFSALEAYRLDIFGSIVGIASFTVISFLGLPPVAWGVVVAVLFALLVPRRVLVVALAASAVFVVALALEQKPGVSWSPYYKIHVVHTGKRSYAVYVNGIPHQNISTAGARLHREPIYGTPYARHSGPLDDVLIVGAGTGTDVAIALAHGARHVDAVEIDPRLYELGKKLQPNHAYQSPRVSVHINDGRAFLEQTKKKYDLILFALPDSLTLVSGQSSLRLESYLFTLQSIEAARAHLKPGGTFSMYNYYRAQWLVDRLAGTLTQVFGKRPCLDEGGHRHFAALAAGNVTCARTWNPGSRAVPAPATDNHPFLYLRSQSIPGFYLLTLLLILGVAIVGVRAAGGPFRDMRPYLDLFCMGAAFLLLETKNVVQFALLFGTTWLVNALVFGGILLVVLAAIEVSRRVRISPRVLYPAVFVTLAVAWIVQPDSLLSLAFVPRLLAATALAFAPIFFANLLFAQRFKDTASLTIAFGANLLGAMTGGILEYLSLIYGYRALLILIAGLYAAAFVLNTGRARRFLGA
jgi:hypothetical protein